MMDYLYQYFYLSLYLFFDGRIAETWQWWGQVLMDISVPRKTGVRKPLASLNKPLLFFRKAWCQGISYTTQREEMLEERM